jgi:hypothetical protein
MRKLSLSGLLLPFLLSVAMHSQQASPSQQTPPTEAQFTAALQSVIANEAKWRGVVEAVKIEDLPVSYAVGKQLEQSRDMVSKGLKTAALWADTANREHTLFAEVNFLSSLQELQGQFLLLVATIDQYQMTDAAAQKKIGNWVDALATVSNGPVQDVWLVAFSHTTHRAHLLDQSCPSTKPIQPN